ncbi:SMC-Scp complex subunit ScpB [Fulvitalea axinellae]|uniref:SMC-Scp complex subunit ScpB n=1 Tax=Fulvitalea axinellae TaxID=1182444 RepID=UPI0030CA55B2
MKAPEKIDTYVEALIFCASSPISPKDIQKCLEEAFESDVDFSSVKKSARRVKKRYDEGPQPFTIAEVAGGYEFRTKPAYAHVVNVLTKQRSQRRLSPSAIETLSIIAYKQPVTKADIERVRGVNSDYSVRTLLEKGLVEIKGKSEALGRPLLYGTSPAFMEYFGINSIKDLPALKDISPDNDNEVGEKVDS